MKPGFVRGGLCCRVRRNGDWRSERLMLRPDRPCKGPRLRNHLSFGVSPSWRIACFIVVGLPLAIRRFIHRYGTGRCTNSPSGAGAGALNSTIPQMIRIAPSILSDNVSSSTHHSNEPAQMTSQHQRRDSNEGQRGDDGEPPKAGQTTGKRGATLGIDGANSPKGCAMQRLVGHQKRPAGSV